MKAFLLTAALLAPSNAFSLTPARAIVTSAPRGRVSVWAQEGGDAESEREAREKKMSERSALEAERKAAVAGMEFSAAEIAALDEASRCKDPVYDGESMVECPEAVSCPSANPQLCAQQ